MECFHKQDEFLHRELYDLIELKELEQLFTIGWDKTEGWGITTDNCWVEGWGILIKEVVRIRFGVWGGTRFIVLDCSIGTIVVAGTWTYLVASFGCISGVATCLSIVTDRRIGADTFW